LTKKFAVAREEARGHVALGEPGIVEVAEHGLGRGLLHGEIVMRAAPRRRLALVAAAAGGIADEARRIGGPGRGRRQQQGYKKGENARDGLQQTQGAPAREAAGLGR
jgi:hypothetical protein